MARCSENDVVEQLDPQQIARLLHLAGHMPVRRPEGRGSPEG